MLPADVATLLARELRALAREVEAYPDEADLWRTAPGVANSAGVLARHLAGNLQYLVGAVLGGSGYVRDRDAEFHAPPVPRAALLAELDAARRAVETTLPALAADALAADFPIALGHHRVTTGELLVHLVAHAAYHLGQVDYHRRLLTGATAAVGAMAIAELGTARPT